MILAVNNVVFPNSDSKISINTHKISFWSETADAPLLADFFLAPAMLLLFKPLGKEKGRVVE